MLPPATRLAVTGERLFGAWHSTDRIAVLDLTSGRELEPIILEDFDDYIDGFAVTTDGILAVGLNLSLNQGHVARFDVKTGARIRDLTTTSWLAGLACVTR